MLRLRLCLISGNLNSETDLNSVMIANSVFLKLSCRRKSLFVCSSFVSSIVVFTSALGNPGIPSESQEVPDLPLAITSFGAVNLNGTVFVYGGHSGEAHSYSADTTLPHLWSYSGSGAWNQLMDTSRSQGASLLSYHGKLMRIGGLQATNSTGEKEHLISLNEVGVFDPASNEWKDMTSLPAPRSSHDAVVVEDQVFVIGGWQLNGLSEDAEWYDEMFVGSIKDDGISWTTVPQPFQTRANAVTAAGGKIYSVGGMTATDGTTGDLWIYDIESREWSQGSALPKGIMDGFGAAACELGGRVYVSAYMGIVYRLSTDGQEWESVGKLKERRFFHRLVPFGDHQLMAIAGANRQSGHLADVELFPIP